MELHRSRNHHFKAILQLVEEVLQNRAIHFQFVIINLITEVNLTLRNIHRSMTLINWCHLSSRWHFPSWGNRRDDLENLEMVHHDVYNYCVSHLVMAFGSLNSSLEPLIVAINDLAVENNIRNGSFTYLMTQ